MKRCWFLVIVWVLILAVFCGCAGRTAQAGQQTEKGLSHSGKGPSQTAVSGIPKVADPGNSLVPYEEDRQLYIGCENTEMDIYFGETANITWAFPILSREPIDTENFRVQIPIQNQYETYILPAEFPRTTSFLVGSDDPADMVFTFSYDLYAAYCGLDYSEVRATYEAAEEDGFRSAQEIADYDALLNAYLPAYQRLTEEDLPVFYYYNVSIVFATDKPYTESFSEVEFEINGQLYHRQIGQVNLIDGPPPYDYPISYMGAVIFRQPSNVYGDDICRSNQIYDFVAEKDMTLSRFTTLGEETEILDLFVQITAGENTTDFYWDGQSPVYVCKGDRVRVSMIYKRPGASGLFCNILVYTELDCIVDGETKAWVTEQNLCQNAYNPYFLYAIIFDGLDLEDYYRDFYYGMNPNRSWREAYLPR